MRGKRAFFISGMFSNGIISSQEVFRINLVRNCFHFSSAEMRWEPSLWCEPSHSSESHGSETLLAHGKDTLGSLGPTHPTHAFCSLSSIALPCSPAGALQALPISKGRNNPPSQNPSFSLGKPISSCGI